MNCCYSQDKITPFGGLYFVNELLSQEGITELINTHLGPRAANSRYEWSDLFYGMLAIFILGGDCAEDIQEHIGPGLQAREFSVASPDTLLRFQKNLASPPVEYCSRQGITHQFNWNGPLARLNIKLLKNLGQIQSGRAYTMDYDNVIIEAEKADSLRTYCRPYGYHPGVAMIGDRMVYVQNRNGNSEPKFRQYRTLRRAFSLLKAEGITVKRFRADSGSYIGKVIDWVSRQCDSIYIKARMDASVKAKIAGISDWKQDARNPQKQWASVEYTPFKRPRNRWSEEPAQTFRLVVERVPNSDGQADLFTDDAYSYQAILSSDWEASPKQIFEFYRQRGANEREFDVLKNDFGWNNMPFSKLNENTVFLMLTAIIRNFYGFVIQRFSARLDYLRGTYRLKKFIFRFITVPAKWIYSARQWWLKLYTSKLYPD